jgi:ferredoxin
MIKKHDRVLLVGCGTCVTVCLAGGEREVGIIGSALRMSLRLAGCPGAVVDECTIERQCEDAFIDLLAIRAQQYDAICSLGCGAGVQALAERFPKMPIYPGLNTQFMGILESQGVWTEKCSGCGNCRLGEFMGVCPITRCAKRLLNGPCGGSRNGTCEVSPNLECGWQLIRSGRVLGVS